MHWSYEKATTQVTTIASEEGVRGIGECKQSRASIRNKELCPKLTWWPLRCTYIIWYYIIWNIRTSRSFWRQNNFLSGQVSIEAFSLLWSCAHMGPSFSFRMSLDTRCLGRHQITHHFYKPDLDCWIFNLMQMWYMNLRETMIVFDMDMEWFAMICKCAPKDIDAFRWRETRIASRHASIQYWRLPVARKSLHPWTLWVKTFQKLKTALRRYVEYLQLVQS